MKVKVLTNIDDLDITKDAWNRLASDNETNTIFQTYDWFQCWWSIFGQEHSLFFIIVYADDGSLLGFAPLAIENSRHRKHALIFAGDGNADYLDFVTPLNKSEVLFQIFLVIKNNQHRWRRIMLRNIPGNSTTTGLINSFSRCNMVYSIVESTTVCPTLIINNREDGAQHIANKYSTKRPYNYFRKLGRLSHQILDNSNAINTHLEPFFQQHILRWQDTGTPSLFLDDNNKTFYRTLANKLVDNSELLFSVVKLNEKPLAYHYGFDYNGVITWYKPAFDIEHAKHSPGTLMARYLINYCLDNKKTELDFTIGDEPFKKRFTNMRRFNINLRIFTNKSNYYLFCTKMAIKKIIKKVLRRKD
jgi:CelD/BcsL family acetyltransferase involved in cellulose biosynthesis